MFDYFALLDIGTPELLLILAVLLVLFGGKKLPELSRSFGESISEVKKGAGSAQEIKQELQSHARETRDSLTKFEQ